MPGSTSRRLIVGLSLSLLLGTLTGCAAFRPMEGVPARYLPADLKMGERSGKRSIDFSLLSQKPPAHYLLDSGDVLAVYVEGEVGKSTDPPPVHFPLNNEGPATFGLPFPVREDGTVSLPKVGSISVRGLSIAQAEQRVKQAYLAPLEIIHPQNYRVQVSLQRPRHYRVLVIRQDSRTEPLANAGAGGINLGLVKRGSGKLVSLPAYSNDVLNALTATDGLPGLDAEPAVYVIRRRSPRSGGTLDPQWPTDLNPALLLQRDAKRGTPVVRGQSDASDSSYWHTSPLNSDETAYYSRMGRLQRDPQSGADHGGAAPSIGKGGGSLHEPMRLPEAGLAVQNGFSLEKTSGSAGGRQRDARVGDAQYGNVRQAIVRQPDDVPMVRQRSVQHANWTGYGDEQSATSDVGRFQYGGTDARDAVGNEPISRIEQAAAWSEPRRSNRHGDPFSDPNAESRAVQLMNHDAWSSRVSSRQSDLTGSMSAGSRLPQLQGSAPTGPAGQPAPLLSQPSLMPNLPQSYGDQPLQGDPSLSRDYSSVPRDLPYQTVPARQRPPQLQMSPSQVPVQEMPLNSFNPQPGSMDRPEHYGGNPGLDGGRPDEFSQRMVSPQPGQPPPTGAQPGGPVGDAMPLAQPATQWPIPMPGAGAYPVQEVPIEMGHSVLSNLDVDGRHVIRIPIRLGPGEAADIREEDVILQDGDIVFIESRDTEVFFTGGLLGGGQYTLPRDYDLDILQALSLATARGSAGASRVVGGLSALNNDVSISPSTVIVLRKLPDGGEVPIKIDLYRARTDMSERITIQPGDYILLQYTPLEAIAAFFERHLLEGALFGLASQSFTSGN